MIFNQIEFSMDFEWRKRSLFYVACFKITPFFFSNQNSKTMALSSAHALRQVVTTFGSQSKQSTRLNALRLYR